MSKPFETTFATLRRGAASMEATEAMQQVVKSVYETGKPAKLVIELTVKPNTKNGGGIRTTQINQKVISYSDQIDTFVGTFDVFDLEDSPLINILAERFWIVF